MNKSLPFPFLFCYVRPLLPEGCIQSVMSPPVLMDPDWNEIWKQRQELHELSKSSDDPSHDWNRKENAERYDANARSEYDDRVKTTMTSVDINRNSRILDIGSGPGTLAIPFAPLVREVTAVEPGAGMLEILRNHAEKLGIR